MTIEDVKREYELALINQMTSEDLSEDDVYVFSIRLCDSKVDSHNECFTVDALFDLKTLYVGKTGIIETDDGSKNVTARIISCEIERDGFDYVLTARAFIPKTKQTQSIVNYIEDNSDIGVSVGAAVGACVCSICNNAMASPLCNHHKGDHYSIDNTFELCYGKIVSATDAYEFNIKLPKPKKYKAKVRRVKRKKDAGQKAI